MFTNIALCDPNIWTLATFVNHKEWERWRALVFPHSKYLNSSSFPRFLEGQGINMHAQNTRFLFSVTPVRSFPLCRLRKGVAEGKIGVTDQQAHHLLSQLLGKGYVPANLMCLFFVFVFADSGPCGHTQRKCFDHVQMFCWEQSGKRWTTYLLLCDQ